MNSEYKYDLKYSIMDPTGNITALVESAVEPADRLSVAAEIMLRHPEVEQVGFVRYDPLSLSMAGGEFCGNASMSAAALYQLRFQPQERKSIVQLQVSGAVEPVAVYLEKEDRHTPDSMAGSRYRTKIAMPPAVALTDEILTFEGISASVPVVHMEGISHIMIEANSPFTVMQNSKTAEGTVRTWCREGLRTDGLGLMFLSETAAVPDVQSTVEDQAGPGSCNVRPLVYIPAGDTCFWENSCASGSAAVGMYFAHKRREKVRIRLQEPGGELIVESNPATGVTMLSGSVCLRADIRRRL